MLVLAASLIGIGTGLLVGADLARGHRRVAFGAAASLFAGGTGLLLLAQ